MLLQKNIVTFIPFNMNLFLFFSGIVHIIFFVYSRIWDPFYGFFPLDINNYPQKFKKYSIPILLSLIATAWIICGLFTALWFYFIILILISIGPLIFKVKGEFSIFISDVLYGIVAILVMLIIFNAIQ